MLMLTGFNYFIPQYINDWEFGESYLERHIGRLAGNIRIRIRHTRSRQSDSSRRRQGNEGGNWNRIQEFLSSSVIHSINIHRPSTICQVPWSLQLPSYKNRNKLDLSFLSKSSTHQLYIWVKVAVLLTWGLILI